MSGSGSRGPLDALVEKLADLLDGFGLNGTKLRWRWNRRRRDLAEGAARGDRWLRSTRVQHKMCPACRALVDRDAGTCPDCGASLSGVSRPGLTRSVGNLLPGISSATPLILLANGLWFVLMLMAHMRSGDGGMSLFGGLPGALLDRFGAGRNFAVDEQGRAYLHLEWWRLVTPIFLHGGLLHFAMNSMFLLQVGRIAESLYGTARFWTMYLVCGLTGSVFSLILSVELLGPMPRLTVGASGALMGMLGLLIVHSVRYGSVLGDLKRTLFQFGFYMLLLTFMFNLDHWAHAGGLAAGLLFGLTVAPEGHARRRVPDAVWQSLGFLGILLVLLAFQQVASSARG